MLLTYPQRKLLNAILDHFARTGMAPTIDELREVLRYEGGNSVWCNIQALVKQGCLKPVRGRHRGLLLAGPACVRRVGEGIGVVPGRPMTDKEAILCAGEILALVGTLEISHAATVR